MKRIITLVAVIMLMAYAYAHASSSLWPGDTSTANWSQSGSDLYYVGNVAVGDTNLYGALTVGGVTALKETTAPALQAGYGKLYVKTSTHKIYFLSEGGVEYDLTAAAGSGAPTDAQYLVMTSHVGLLDQRIMTQGAGITITDAGVPGGAVTVSIGNDAIKDTMIDWGTGAGQVDADDMPEGSTNKFYTDAKARSAISSTATGLTYTSGTGVLSLTASYAIPTTTSIANWGAAYTHKTTQDAIAGLIACDGSGGYSGVTNSSSNWNDAYTKRVDTWTAPLTLVANVASIPKATAAVDGYLAATDFTTFAGFASKENVLTFSSGLTRVTDTITNDLITGKAGGQTIIGGTQASENLRLQSTTNVTRGYVVSDDNFLCDKAFGIAQIGGTAGKYVSFQGGAMAADTLYTMPTAFPGSTAFLKSTNAGILSWDTAVYLTAEVDGSTTNEINTVTADTGGTTSGLAITLAGSGITTTVRSGDTVTITSTEADTLSTVIGRQSTALEIPQIINKVASATARNLHNTEATTTSKTMDKVKTITLTNGLVGQARFLFDMHADGTNLASAEIRRNGTIIGATQTDTNAAYQTKSQDITQTFNPGDTVELWAMCDATLVTAYVQNFQIAYDDAPTVAVASTNS